MESDSPLPEPSQRLSPAALNLWHTTGAIWALAFVFAGIFVSGAIGDWDDAPGFLTPLVWLLVVVASVVRAVIEPRLRWRRWRYEIRPEEIDIRRGVWSIERTLVPMARVQHVDTESGVLQQGFNLATVSFHTAAGAIEIPQLNVAEAAAVRDRIATFARTGADDV